MDPFPSDGIPKVVVWRLCASPFELGPSKGTGDPGGCCLEIVVSIIMSKRNQDRGCAL